MTRDQLECAARRARRAHPGKVRKEMKAHPDHQGLRDREAELDRQGSLGRASKEIRVRRGR